MSSPIHSDSQGWKTSISPFLLLSSTMARVYVDMVADLFHFGHMEFLRKAKEKGDFLIVGVCRDEDCVDYKRRPVMTLDERVKSVQGCRYVDEVVPGCPFKVTKEFILANRIDLVIHGDDMDWDTLCLYYKEAMDLGVFMTVPYTTAISTSKLLARIFFREDELRRNARTDMQNC